jgi:hypothetical protein|tara:strand:+ start:209 stop:394 length:186 start_codon:yes stop_codon:yes gene_type:complete
MKTKKIRKGWYEVTYNNNKYEVEQNFDLFDNGWQLIKDGEHIDTCSTFTEAKEVIKQIEGR